MLERKAPIQESSIGLFFFSTILHWLCSSHTHTIIPWTFVNVPLKSQKARTGQSLVKKQSPQFSTLSFS